ncbi:CLUMA_CG008587, isoform A [Clunio marinus]|uniref:CLUMA_CG008587, isoform A n=1 Tax=Clunio marinus TaxID=568069 RepID=A0A1J1I493_9DIPT|nr:CLUMA_CG008587, isoform A [Clunio marinus]
MKTLIIFSVIFIISSTTIQAAPLQSLSDKLTSSSGGDQTKERVPNDEPYKPEASNKSKFENDENVKELDGLKTQTNAGKEAVEITDKVEDSLRKIHDMNPQHKSSDDKPPKKYRGAARLAFGQNAEEATEIPTTVKQKEILENLPFPEASEATTSATKNGQRRSVKSDLSVSADSILRHLNGKYSAYDMAQYIFWTGDEEGVAKAIEELIDEGLMSRENAITFLNDIRIGIDYLENTYNLKNGETKNTSPFVRFTSFTTSTTEAPVEDLPFNYNYNYQKFHSFFKPSHKNKIHFDEDETPTLSPVVLKVLEKIPSLLKLTEVHSFNNKQGLKSSFDEEGGRSRLADFLYGEYPLEEVIYQLAKVMFTQSLTHGSEESQDALQKLTQFLDNEGKNGRISPTLQKKVLDVLLAALSDTLSENPEVMEKARHAIMSK